MRRIGLIDVDGHGFPSLPLMKLSAWHKSMGDSVEWYQPMLSGHMDTVYMSKVFSFTPDYEYFIDADRIVRGGTGYAISLTGGKEAYDRSKDAPLPDAAEHIYPDYGIYPGQAGTAYGFLTRGCPRGCGFCHVAAKEGRRSYKAAGLSEFWDGQKEIVLYDPNILACPEWEGLLRQLAGSGARVDFTQGLDIRMMDGAKARLLSRIRARTVRFAWDRYEDRDIVQPKFLEFREQSRIHPHHLQVYVLCGAVERRVLAQDLYRIGWLRDNGYAPFVMLYDREGLPRGHELRKLQRWVNNRRIFWSCSSFDEYRASVR